MTEIYPLQGKRVWVAGHGGMVGSALVRRLAREKCEILTVDRKAVDLTNQAQTHEWVMAERPQAVFLAAARVGGILANDTYPADFLYDNVMIEARPSRSLKTLCSLGRSSPQMNGMQSPRSPG